jgi:hypothetical protein
VRKNLSHQVSGLAGVDGRYHLFTRLEGLRGRQFGLVVRLLPVAAAATVVLAGISRPFHRSWKA